MSMITVRDDTADVVVALQHMHTHLPHTEDFKFISRDEKREFGSHSLIVAIHSPVLRNEIYGPLSSKRFHIKNVDDIAITSMIRHFYEQDVVFERVSDITETKKLADQFQILELGEICRERLAGITVELSNVISVYETTIEFNNTEKQLECLSLISHNKDIVFKSSPFNELEFEIVLDIFEKLKSGGSLTESEFLYFGIQWLETNERIKEKDLLMDKIDLSNVLINAYLDILVSFPEFFSSSEISDAVKVIKSSETSENVQEVNVGLDRETENNAGRGLNFRDVGINTDNKSVCHNETNTEKGPDYQHAGTNTEKGPDHQHVGTNTETISSIGKAPFLQNLKKLTIKIFKEVDEDNMLNSSDSVKVFIEDDNCCRSLIFSESDVFKNGLIGSMKKDVRTYTDVEVSYEGIYYLVRCLKSDFHKINLSPLQSIEVLRAAIFFKLGNVIDQCILKIGQFNCWDPVFLEGLRFFENYIPDKCKDVIASKTFEVILHPNFITCSGDLLTLLLDCKKLNIKSELQLLFITIQWLEALNRQRWCYRFTLLNKIAFENISVKDFQSVLLGHPDFFEDVEKTSILDYKKAEGENVMLACRKLPDWYNKDKRRILTD